MTIAAQQQDILTDEMATLCYNNPSNVYWQIRLKVWRAQYGNSVEEHSMEFPPVFGPGV